jgi:P27 family predicted phage terminase small subunit
MGRPRKPTAIKAAEGNRGRRPLNLRELMEEPEMPACPDWLDEHARAAWDEVTPILLAMGVVRPADQAELGSLCSAMSILRLLRKQLEAIPEDRRFLFRASKGSIQPNPLLSMINRQVEIVHRIACEFGMTPASRVKLLADDAAPVPGMNLSDLIDGPAESRPDDPVM